MARSRRNKNTQPAKVENTVVEVPAVVEQVLPPKDELVFENRLGELVYDYALKVGEEQAVKLAQYLLNIRQTGVVDEVFRSAYGAVSNKADFHNDYKNLMK